MNRTRFTIAVTAAFSLLALMPVQAEKVLKTPKTPEQVQKYERLHSSAPTPVAQAPRASQTRSSTVSPQPYTRGGSDSTVTRRPGSTPSPQRSYGSGGDITVINPNRPGSPISQQPYRRGEDHGGYSYNGGGRAYSVPHHDGHDYGYYDNDYHHDNDWWFGGWGWGPSWGFGFGYRDPWGPDVIAVPYPVQGPTVYYPYPQVEYVPQQYPVPVTAEAAPATPPEQLPLLGCDIVAGDGTFLGVVDKEYNSPQSIANRDGKFGSRTSEQSIWNPNSPYGSPNGKFSPWNDNAEQPPMLTWHGAFKGYLTRNPKIEPRVSPDALAGVIEAAPWR
ncbi:MAG: hypothetical protein ACM3VW_06570 [Bacteroidota bacterium]